MAGVAELHQEAQELRIHQNSELISQQFAIACHLPQHPCQQLCHRPTDDRLCRRRSLVGRSKNNIQQYFAQDPLNNTRYKSAFDCIHQDAVRTAIECSSSKLLNGRQPFNAITEQTLPRKTRTVLVQLCSVHSHILGQYMNRIDSTAHNHCRGCAHSSHDTHHPCVCLRGRPHWQSNRYGRRRPKPRNTST